MLEYHIDNIVVVGSDKISHQSVGNPMGTNCAPLFADLVLHPYEVEFIQNLLYAVAFSLIF
jgi:hypothetical protein